MTLSFSWATNTNYSTGPDSGTPTKEDPASTANGFIKGTIISPKHINFMFDAVGDQLVQAVDGIGGGTYALTAPLIFTGDDIRVGSGADLQLLTGGAMHVQGTSRLVIEGPDAELTIDPFGTLFVDTDGALQVDGDFIHNGTGTVGSGATFRIHTSQQLTINAPTDSFRLTLTPQSVQADAGGTDPSWRPRTSATAFCGTTEGWFQHDVTSGFTIAFPLNLPIGDDIVTVVAQVDGSQGGVDHAAKPTGGDLPTLALIRVDGTGVASVVARRADQSANVTAYNSLHTITLASGALDAGTLPHTVDANYSYYVVMTGETGANAEADKFGLLSLSGTCTARAYRSALMVY